VTPKLGETIVLDFVTHSPTTAAVTDADSTPTAEVFEDATDTTVVALTVVKRTSKTGNYRVAIACTALNGFEAAKSYNVVASATVGGIAAKSVIGRFQVRTQSVDDVLATSGYTAPLDAAATAAAVWNAATVTYGTGGSYGALVELNLDAAVSTRSTFAGGAVASVTAPVAVSDKAGFKLASDGLDAVVVETGINARQALSPILASAAGVLSGAETTTVTVKGGGVATTRVTATVDADGNRSSVTLNLPS
jgi:hypothetical protein